MPADTINEEMSLLAAFADLDAAQIAGSLLRDAGIDCDEETPIGVREHGVTVAALSPARLETARVILRHAGATEIIEGTPRPQLLPLPGAENADALQLRAVS